MVSRVGPNWCSWVVSTMSFSFQFTSHSTSKIVLCIWFISEYNQTYHTSPSCYYIIDLLCVSFTELCLYIFTDIMCSIFLDRMIKVTLNRGGRLNCFQEKNLSQFFWWNVILSRLELNKKFPKHEFLHFELKFFVIYANPVNLGGFVC